MTEQSAFTPRPRDCWIAGVAEQAQATHTVTHPFDGSEVADVAVPSAEQVRRALDAAAGSVRLPAEGRAAALDTIATAITARAEEFAETITAESGKPLRWAQIEVEHAASGCRLAAEATRRIAEEPRLLQRGERGPDRLAILHRAARGPVLAITAASFPLNLAAHEAAAAIAVGAPVLVKPATATPLSALLLGEVLADMDLPAGTFSVLPVPGAQCRQWLPDERIGLVSFTGSAATGKLLDGVVASEKLLRCTGMRSAAIVHRDYTAESDVDFAAERIAWYASAQAGQSPLAVRRAVLHSAVAERCTERIVAKVAELRTGNPFDPEVTVGPLVDTADADTAVRLIEQAVDAGAILLHGGQRDGNLLTPTVLADVPEDAALCREEIVAPVLMLSTVDSLDAAVNEVNRTNCLGPTGLFSHRTQDAMAAGHALAGAGVTIGEVPAHRADELPFPAAQGAGTGTMLLQEAMRARSTEQVTVLPIG